MGFAVGSSLGVRSSRIFLLLMDIATFLDRDLSIDPSFRLSFLRPPTMATESTMDSQ